MTPTIQRMGEDLVLAGKRPSTVKNYCDTVRRFERWLGKPVEEASADEVRTFLLELRERGLAPRTYTVYLAALCFLFRQTLSRPQLVDGLPSVRAPRTPIVVPTVDEVRAILDCAATPFARTMMETAYACGLRASEVRCLQGTDIDSRRGLVHVRQGKGGKDRVVMLGEVLLAHLRRHWRLHRLPGPWLFPRQRPPRDRVHGQLWFHQPVSPRWLGNQFRAARRTADIRRRITLHGLRHAFATHLLEHGVDTAVLRVLMGHQDLATTAHYATVRTHVLASTPSPLDLLHRR